MPAIIDHKIVLGDKFVEDILSDFRTAHEASVKEVDNWIKDLKVKSKDLSLSGIDSESIKKQQELSVAVAKVTEAKKILKTNEEKLQEVERKSNEILTEYGKKLEKVKQEAKEKTDLAKKDIAISREQEGSYKKLSLELQKNINAYKKLSQAQRDNSAIGGKLLTTIQGQQASLKRMDASMGNFQRNVGNYRDALNGLPGPIGRAVSSTSTLVSSVGKLGPIGAGVVAILTAIGAPLVAFFTKAEDGAELLERKLAGVKASFGILVGELIKGGRSITESIDDTNKKTSFWQKTLSALGTVGGIGLQTRFAAIGIAMDQANQSAQKYTKTLQELEDLERAMIVPRAIANQKIAEAKLLYEDETKSINERIAALKKSLTLEIETVNNEIKHQQAVVSNVRMVNDEKRKAGQLRDEDDRKLQEALAKEIDLRTESTIKQRKLQSTINAANKELLKQQDEINKSKQRELDIIENSKLTLLKSIDVKIDNKIVPLTLEFTISKESDKNLIDTVNDWITNNKDIIDSANEFAQSMSKLLLELNQAQIESAQKEVDIQEDKLNDLKSKLDEEKALKDEGKANDYDRTITQIAETQKLKDEANKKLEKAQKREAAINLASQASDIITATANIITGWTEINPVAGVLLGLAQVAAMVTAFVSYKNKINSISKYGEGEVDINGKPHSEGGEVVEIEGGESIIKKKATQQSKRLLNAINEGLVSDFDLYKLNLNTDLSKSNYQRYDSTSEMLNELKQSRATNEAMLKHMKSKPVIAVLPDGRVVEIFSKYDVKVVSFNK